MAKRMTKAQQAEALLRVIGSAKAELIFAVTDEVDGIADRKTRAVRLRLIRDALEGVGDIEARQALGFLPTSPD